MGNENPLSTVPVSAPVRDRRWEGVPVGETSSKAVTEFWLRTSGSVSGPSPLLFVFV